MIRSIVILSLTLIAMASCDSNRMFEEFRELPEGWAVVDTASFPVYLTQGDKDYRMTTQFRCDISYPFNNLYYHLILRDSRRSVLSSNLEQVLFFEPKTGKPLGSGLGDLYSVEQTIDRVVTLNEPDTVWVQLIQYMRQDTLKGIDRVGLRVDYASAD